MPYIDKQKERERKQRQYATIKSDPIKWAQRQKRQAAYDSNRRANNLEEIKEKVRISLRKWRKSHPEKDNERNRISRDTINQAKAGGECRCGVNDPRLLEFHHEDSSIKGTELGGPRARHWSNKRILEEVAKCILSCANCHRIHTWEEWEKVRIQTPSPQLKYIRRKRDALNKIKSEAGCRRCKNNDFRCLDFHHLDQSDKSFEICAGVSKGLSMKIILVEVSKCEILCANCHRLEHSESKKCLTIKR